MLKFSVAGVEPVEILEQVRLPFPQYSSDPDEERPLVNIYRYRFSDNRGLEVCTYSYLTTCHLRDLEYEKDSNAIKTISGPSWSHKETAKKSIRKSIRDAKFIESIRESVMKHG